MTLTATPPASTIDTFDRALASLEWTIHGTDRDRLAAGVPLRRAHTASGFVYLSSGRVRLTAADGTRDLDAGDLVFFPRAHTTTVVALEDAELLDVAFTPPGQRQQVAETLPEHLYVADFAGQEPSMVALIEGMGCPQAVGRPRAGDTVICSRIATTIVSAALRTWNEAGCAPDRWLQRIGDPHIGAVLDALHAEPGRPWTFETLARIAMMSRSAFAERFREVVGHTPRAYLTTVRMETAKGLILTGDASVAELAGALGYVSEDGFARAFQRYTGLTPARWRAEAAQAA
ncbi:AraC-type DNA-binding protein [Plantibacter flavus]|uniref:AraC-like DNA-binding protein n=1 Tax=Plantibacter flavus TaxID=150123 RepID=A0A3N2BYR3_9MICO|nr:AraC family transcriptional regulator [Plantibacter flavus]ROR80381.1 AraC-like DNA-binding protein [Plantibacter flavus]SMG34831.1 AraC-type DNA-binding protein [Plantibacter flavus]